MESPATRIDLGGASVAAPAPADVVAAWPPAHRLVALMSSDQYDDAGWSVLAVPTAWRQAGHGDLGRGDAARHALRSLLTPPTTASPSPSSSPCPFGGGWAAILAYELGRAFEPALDQPAGPIGTSPDSDVAVAIDDRDWPDVLLARIDGGLAFDHATRQWWWFGAAPPPIRRFLMDTLEDVSRNGAPAAGSFTIGPDEITSLDDAGHEAAVAAAKSAIASGEVFQANITRRRTVSFEGSIRDLGLAAFAAAAPRYGAILEAPDGRGLISISPELFLEVDPRDDESSRRVRTQPIKGTAPAPCTPDPDGVAALLSSEKDAAELAMIVDLMRNDLGRVAARGRVRITRPRHIETHATLHHAVAEVEAELGPGVDITDVLAATFPPGSVTGAPKIRAMQVIDRIEPVRRGPYCGAVGWIGDDGSARLNVAIRTLVISGQGHGSSPARLDYASGGGIVADSDPRAERLEADVKAEVFRRTLLRATTTGVPETATAPAST